MSSGDEDEGVAVEVNSDVEQELNQKRYVRKRDNSKLVAQRQRRAAMRAQLKAEGAQRSQAPEAALTLKHVFGYRGYDSHNNVCVTVSGHLVYHVAAVGIIHQTLGDAQQFYIGHTDDILCLGVHPSLDLVATGQIGKSADVHVWSSSSGKAEALLTDGHSVGVCATDFSADGELLVSLGLDNYHSIVVWQWQRGEKLAETRGHQDRLFDCIFNPFDQTQLVSVGVKHIKFWQHKDAGLTGRRGVFGKVARQESMFCAAYADAGALCATGSSSGGIYVWATADRQLQRVVEGHKGPVFALAALKLGFMSGGKDGSVRLWADGFDKCLKKYSIDAKNGDEAVGRALGAERGIVRAVCLLGEQIVLGTKQAQLLLLDRSGQITLLNQGHGEGEVWGLAVHPTAAECATASDDGRLRCWTLGDRPAMTRQHALTHGAARCVAYSPDAALFAVGFLNGSVQIIDADSMEVRHDLAHRQEEISDVKFSPDGAYVAAASHDNFVDIYEVASGKRLGICKAASSYITHIDWTADGEFVSTNTGDGEVLYFAAPSGAHQNQLQPISAEHELEWASRTRVLGPYLHGVWPACSDVTDVNAANVHGGGQLVVTGDDFGFVKLFTYPAKAKYAKCKSYLAHSAHVTNVRFTADGDWLTSVGGADTALAVWSLEWAGHGSGGRSDSPDTDSQEEG